MSTPRDEEPRAVGGTRPLGALDAAVGSLAAMFAVALALGLAAGLREGATNDLVTVVLANVVGYGLVAVGLLARYAPARPLREALGLRSPGVVGFLAATILGLGLAPVSSVVEAALARRFPEDERELELAARLLDVATPSRAVVLVVGLGLVLPVVEELFFRGILFGGLERAGRARDAVLVTAVCDAALRSDLRSAVVVLGLALAFAFVRRATGSAVAATAARVAYFGVAVVPLALGRGEPAFDLRFAAAGAGLAALGAGALVLVQRRLGVAAAADAAAVDAPPGP